MRPLDAPLGRRRVGANAVDVELVQRPRKLCVAGALVRAGMIYSENAGLVAVERQWLAVFGGLLRIMYIMLNYGWDVYPVVPVAFH